MGEGNFRPLQATAVPNLVEIRPRRLLEKWVKYNENFYLFIYTFFSSTHLQVRRDDGFSRLMAQTTRTRARMCLLGVSLTLLPILGLKSPKTQFWGVNRRFQAKRAKYWKFHVIETTASISTKFCTTIETIKWSSGVVPISAQQIQDGDGRHFEKKR